MNLNVILEGPFQSLVMYWTWVLSGMSQGGKKRDNFQKN